LVRVTPRKSRRRRNERRRQPREGRTDNRTRQEAPRSGNNGENRKQNNTNSKGREMNRQEKNDQPRVDDRPVMTIEDQARIASEFLEGLVAAYGLEGRVSTSVIEDVIVADVSGEQTEALVGVRGSVRSAIHELTRTVMQRYAQDTARLRLDIAGYAERRRQALTIYAERLIDQLLEEGGEIMLEPMNSADRKVVHDAAAAIEGVRTHSEGDDPRRAVVISPAGGDSS